MEVKEGNRIVVAKPVASRPTCSTFRSFSNLLNDAINASPPNGGSEATVPAIRPKTVRYRPILNHAPTGLISPQAQIFKTSIHNSSDSILTPTVVYKPTAKIVSKTTVSLLANMGNTNGDHQQLQQALPDLSSNLVQTSLTSKTLPQVQDHEEDPKALPPTKAGVDRPSYDGYNWRKYGQKQVKGSEYPRSYYKCTHPNCPVKKKVERSLDGQIAEIVYKGEHSHSKPQPPKRNTSGSTGVVPEGTGTGQVGANPLWNGNNRERNEGSEGRVENTQNEGGLSAQLAYQGNALVSFDPVVNAVTIPGCATPDTSCGLSGEGEEGSKGLDAENDEPRTKRRKSENQGNEAGVSVEQEPRIVVQSSTDTEIIGDGFRWRKYGQKVVKGNPYPRSYYRCTSVKCNMRKHVERASEDPKAFITTYEGKHNHDMPLRGTNPAAVASEPESLAASKDKS